MKHFLNYSILMDTTKKIRQSNTVNLFPTTSDDPTITPTETLSLIIEDLLTVLKDLQPMSPFIPQLLGLTNAVKALYTTTASGEECAATKGIRGQNNAGTKGANTVKLT